MKTYQYHSSYFGTTVQVTYNKNGFLVGFSVNEPHQLEGLNVDVNTHPYFKNWATEAVFVSECKQRNVKLTQVDRAVTFEMFWQAYGNKDCGRMKAELSWNKLSKTDQIEAFDFIPALNSKLKLSQLAKPYATTYLNQRRWAV